jgi:hypothetical protein
VVDFAGEPKLEEARGARRFNSSIGKTSSFQVTHFQSGVFKDIDDALDNIKRWCTDEEPDEITINDIYETKSMTDELPTINMEMNVNGYYTKTSNGRLQYSTPADSKRYLRLIASNKENIYALEVNTLIPAKGEAIRFFDSFSLLRSEAD